MPLKHATETLLVFLLAVALLLTGVVLKFLPVLPGGLLWWSVAFVCALLYPLLLYPLLRRRRADYALRALHFFPALALFVWLVASLASQWITGLGWMASLLSWGLGIVPVALGVVLLAFYCLSVIRQRTTRIPLLMLLLLPFTLLGLTTEWQGWGEDLQAAVKDPPRAQANLEPSAHEGESQWRGILRRMERREQRLQRNEDPFTASSAFAVQSTSAPVMIAVQSSARTSKATSSAAVVAQVSSPMSKSSSARTVVMAPPNLTSSGFGTDALAVALVAGYCAVLQRRAIARRHQA